MLTGCENVNAARRHLTRLSAAKLVHYSTNDYVYVTWLAWMDFDVCSHVPALQISKEDGEPARERASSSAPARRSDEVIEHEIHLFGEIDAPLPARGRAGQRADAPVAARGRAGHSHTRLLVSQSVDPIGHRLGDLLTDSAAGIDLDEQRRGVALLMDGEVGLDAAAAWRLAQGNSFGELARQVMTWKRQIQGGMVSGAGALVHRVQEGFGATITDEDRKSALYRRHHPDWREEEERAKRKSYVPDEYADIIIH